VLRTQLRGRPRSDRIGNVGAGTAGEVNEFSVGIAADPRHALTQAQQPVEYLHRLRTGRDVTSKHVGNYTHAAALIIPWRGATLFTVVDSIDRDHTGEQLARFLAALQRPATREHVKCAVGELPTPRLQSSTAELRARFGRWVRPEQRETIARWCDWADAELAKRRPAVLG
jgi:hypothetical protein